MKEIPFIGRTRELRLLNDLKTKKVANLVVIRGCRRIGKSRLIREFAQGKLFYSFVGLAPTPETTAQLQRNEFSKQLSVQTGLPDITADGAKLISGVWQ